MSKFTDEKLKDNLKLALQSKLSKKQFNEVNDYFIEYYSEVFAKKSTHLPAILAALNHLNNNKPVSFIEWFVKPSLVRVFIFGLGIAVGLYTNS